MAPPCEAAPRRGPLQERPGQPETPSATTCPAHRTYSPAFSVQTTGPWATEASTPDLPDRRSLVFITNLRPSQAAIMGKMRSLTNGSYSSAVHAGEVVRSFRYMDGVCHGSAFSACFAACAVCFSLRAVFRVCHDLPSVFGLGFSFLCDSRLCGVLVAAMYPLFSVICRSRGSARNVLTV